MELLMEHLGKGFLDSLIITMPIVLTAAGIGLVVGILQAVTQVQEQTIAAAPKILGVFFVIIIMGGFFMKILNEYLIDSINLALQVIPKQDEFVLPPSDMRPGSGFFNEDEKTYSGMKKTNTINKWMKTPGKIPISDKKN